MDAARDSQPTGTTILSVTEASALLDVDERLVRKEIEHGLIGKRNRVEVSFAEAVYLLATTLMQFRLGVEQRRVVRSAVESWLTSSPRAPRIELAAGLELNVGRFANEVEERLSAFKKWKRERVAEDAGVLAGEPTFRGSRLSVRKIGEMILEHGDAAVREIREDYPRLTKDDIRFAPRFARAYPRRGRPRREAST